jgi:hypothetical protein
LKANEGDPWGLERLLGHFSLNSGMNYSEPDMEDLAEQMERVKAGNLTDHIIHHKKKATSHAPPLQVAGLGFEPRIPRL